MISTYRCYSANLKEFLKSNGMEWIVIALDVVPPHKQYWLFEKTKKLDLLLQEWSDRKPR